MECYHNQAENLAPTLDAPSCLCGAVVVGEHTAVEGRKVAWERFRLWIHFTDRFCGGNDRERRITASGKNKVSEELVVRRSKVNDS